MSDDMRKMCADIGPQMVPGGYVFETMFGRVLVVNLVNVKGVRYGEE